MQQTGQVKRCKAESNRAVAHGLKGTCCQAFYEGKHGVHHARKEADAMQHSFALLMQQQGSQAATKEPGRATYCDSTACHVSTQ